MAKTESSHSKSSGSKSAGGDTGIKEELTDTVNRAIENPEELRDIAQDFISRASSALEREVRRHPYQVLGTAVSLGYLFGQGWLRAVSKVGFAFLAQQAASSAMPSLGGVGRRSQRKTIH